MVAKMLINRIFWTNMQIFKKTIAYYTLQMYNYKSFRRGNEEQRYKSSG